MQARRKANPLGQKLLLGLIWLVLVVYAFVFAPDMATPEDTFNLIVNLSTGNWSGINPLVVSIFCIMGIFPGAYAAFILFDDSEQKIPATPFCVASMGLGAFALLPYLFLRQPNSGWQGDKNWLLKILDSRLMAISSTIAIAIFLAWGASNGDFRDFISQWQSDRFIHVMTLDFGLLSFLFLAIIPDDIKRRNASPRWFWLAAVLPIFGSLIYWCMRPQLAGEAIQSELTT